MMKVCGVCNRVLEKYEACWKKEEIPEWIKDPKRESEGEDIKSIPNYICGSCLGFLMDFHEEGEV